MKILLNFLLFLLIGCNLSTSNKETMRLTNAQNEYDIQDILIKTRDGATISGILARRKGDNSPKPVIFQYTIYVRDKGRDLKTIKESVDRGYVGVIAYTRGKRYSLEEIWPYEYDANDAYDVLDWISQQGWCNGKIGMYGGSYNGFTQWAACKKMHPALKTIVPYVANRPGMGLPMENNVFINPNYEWSFYVGNNKYLDTLVGNDRQRFRQMQNRWWEQGVAYNKLDNIDGTPNRWFQKWIQHPAYDEYWQKMTPWQEEFAQITIPVLSIDGYYNDSQNSSLYYLREHYKHHPSAEHHLIIGPYSHFGAQRGGTPVINGYQVEENALIQTNEITYQWFDYILKKGKKPAILKDKINYYVMGAKEWRSASSLQAMSNEQMKLYLSTEKIGVDHSLSTQKSSKTNFLKQEVDFANREVWHNDYYPDPIVKQDIDRNTGFNFVSEPLEKDVLVNGSFLGKLSVSINKKDFDFGVTLYELTPQGEYFHLSYIVGRASYAEDFTQRNLLTPNEITSIPFSNTHFISKKISKGSRLVVHININKNPFSELNYGTGKTIVKETIADATEPLNVKWYSSSFVEIPIWKE